MSEIKVLYPKHAPLSVIKIFLFPDSSNFLMTLAISQGAKNWPFLTLIIFPVLAAAINKSVWRHKKAGICKTSTWSATIEHCSAVWTSVKTGIPTSFLILSKIGRDFSKPIPLLPLRLVLLALSKEVL